VLARVQVRLLGTCISLRLADSKKALAQVQELEQGPGPVQVCLQHLKISEHINIT
jgi:hypothetical protein